MPKSVKPYEEKTFVYHFVLNSDTNVYCECTSGRDFRDILFQWGIFIGTIGDYCYLVEGDIHVKYRVTGNTINLFITAICKNN